MDEKVAKKQNKTKHIFMPGFFILSVLGAASFLLFGGINSVSAKNFTIYNALDVNQPYFSVNGTTGFVGIGTTGPSAKLTIYDSTVTNGEHLLTMFNGNLSGVENNVFKMGFDADGAVITGTFLRSANNLPLQIKAGNSGLGITVLYTGKVGIGTTTPSVALDLPSGFFRSSAAAISLLGTGGGGIVMADATGNLFSTSTAAIITPIITASGGWTASGTTVYKTDTNGNVGIGTTGPNEKLSIYNPITTGTGLQNAVSLDMYTSSATPSAEDGLAIKFYNSHVSNHAMGYMGLVTGSNINAGELVFGTQNIYSTNVVERMRIISTGNVGIGTTAPDATLELNSPHAGSPATMFHIDSLSYGVTNLALIEGRLPVEGSAALTLIPNVKAVTSSRTNQYGMKLNSNFDASSGFNVTNYHGIHVSTPTGSSGVVGTYYGLYVDNSTLAGTNYGAYIAGNVGIGTTTPGATLDLPTGSLRTLLATVSGLGNAGNVMVMADNTGNLFATSTASVFPSASGWTVNGTTVYKTDTNGNVGIGTTSPGNILEIQKDQDNQTYLKIINNDATDINSKAGAWYQASTANLLNTANGAGRTGTRYGLILANYSEILTTAGNGLLIGTNQAAPIIFGTQALERMRISSTGNVGIGTTVPLAKFQVAGDVLLGLGSELNPTTTWSNVAGAVYETFTNDGDGKVTFANTTGYGMAMTGDILTLGKSYRITFTTGSGTYTGTQFHVTSRPDTLANALTRFDIAANTAYQIDVTIVTTNGLTPSRLGIRTATGVSDNGSITSMSVKEIGNLYVSNTGNVGIGTTSPSVALDLPSGLLRSSAATVSLLGTGGGGIVMADATGNLFSTSTSAILPPASGGGWTASGTTVYKTDITGNVGIGTTEPGAGSASMNAGTKLEIAGTGTGRGDIDLSATVTADNSFTGILNFLNLDNSDAGGSTRKIVAGIRSTITTTDANAGDDSGGNLIFYTKPEAGDFGEKMRINSTGLVTIAQNLKVSGTGDTTIAGNVGIGTTNPLDKLDVVGNSKLVAATNDTVALKFGIATTDFHTITYNDATGGLNFTSDNGNRPVTFNQGNVGIGTTGPGSKLSVNPDNAGGVQGNIFDARVQGVTGFLVEHISNTAPNYMRYSFINGNVGIGTTTPGATLDLPTGSLRALLATVSGLGNAGNVMVMADNTGNLFATSTASVFPSASGWTVNGTTVYKTDITGNVGIGITNPSQKLDVSGTISTQNIIFNTQQGAYITSVAAQPNIYGTMRNPGDGSGAFPFNQYGELVFQGGTRTGYNNGFSWVTGSEAVGNIPVPTVKMRLTEAGNLGIGTTAPLGPLHVASSVSNNTKGTLFSIENLSTANNTTKSISIDFYGRDTANTQKNVGRILYVPSNANWAGADNAGGFAFYTEVVDSAPQEKLRITNIGNVGIGIAAPINPLHINGPAADNIIGTSEILTLGRAKVTGVSFQQAATFKLGRYTTVGGSFESRTRLDLDLKQDESVADYSTDKNVMTWTNQGNVGIGTTTPGATLDLPTGSLRSLLATISGLGNAGNVMVMSDNSGNLFATSTASVFPSASGWTVNGTTVYKTDITGNVGIGTTDPGLKLDIGATMSNPSTTGTPNGTLMISDHENTGLVVTMGIHATNNGFWIQPRHNTVAGAYYDTYLNPLGGNVGIGTTTPGAKLSVVTTGANVASFTGVTSPYIDITEGSNIGRIQVSDSVYFGSVTGYSLTFRTNTTNNLRLHSGGGLALGNTYYSTNPGSGNMIIEGNVGIGTTTPGAKLDLPTGSLRALLATISGLGNAGNVMVMADNTGNLFATSTASVFSSASGWTVNGTTVYKTDITGNVGIGTTNPQAKLDVNGNIFGSGSLGVSSTLIASGNDDEIGNQFSVGKISRNLLTNSSLKGNELNVEAIWTKTNNSADVSAPDGSSLTTKCVSGTTGNSFFWQTNSTTYKANTTYTESVWVRVAAGTGTISFNNGIGNALGITPTTTWKRYSMTYTIGSTVGTPYVGFASPSPSTTFYFWGWQLEENSSATPYQENNSVLSSSVSTTLWSKLAGFGGSVQNPSVIVDTNGNVGIGTITPGATLDLSGGANFVKTYNVQATGLARTGKSVVMVDSSGSFYTSDTNTATSSTMDTNLNMGGHDILNVNKLTVTTIDPLYTINGKSYSTYAASISGGVKEEYVGDLKISRAKLVNGRKVYENILDFDKIEEGDDLWVWRKVVDFNEDNVQVLITPYGGFADVYYLIESNRIIFRSSEPIKVSYRLIGKRIDWRSWPTKQPAGENKGIIIN